MSKIAQRQFITKIAGIDGLWATFSGGEVSVGQTKTFDGGSTVPDILTANGEISDVTTSRTYDPDRDGPIEATLQRALSQQRAVRTTITRQPTDEDYTPSGPTKTFEVQLKTVTPPEADANSGDAARISLVWGCRSVR